MTVRNRTRATLRCAASVIAVVVLAPVAAGATAPRALDPDIRFYVPPPSQDAFRQWIDLLRHHNVKGAFQLAAMIAQGHAVWFTGGTPAEVEKQVRKTMQAAAIQRRVPVLVAYNVPYRDCGQFSAGGATTTAEYVAWIDGVAKGIGSGKAVVILEPDGLGIIPYNVDLQGVHEWCQPAGGSSALADARYEQLNTAVDRLEQAPGTSVYLDGTHSSWLSSGEAAYRLVKAGVLRAQGFFVNASNYQPTPQLVQYGTWISKCIAFATNGPDWAAGHFDWCGSQYYPATSSDYSTWHLTDEKYAAEVDPNITGVELTHFVIDTSRNGQGPWHPTVSYPDAQDWCNPPGRGVGARPTASTGVPVVLGQQLVDAYLWVKVPGESDGSCNRGIAGSTIDPEWGMVDPPAGAWFPQQALQLAQLASPPLLQGGGG
jgi:endoglucanase